MNPQARYCGACTALELFQEQPRRDPFQVIAYGEDAHQQYIDDMLGLPGMAAL